MEWGSGERGGAVEAKQPTVSSSKSINLPSSSPFIFISQTFNKFYVPSFSSSHLQSQPAATEAFFTDVAPC